MNALRGKILPWIVLGIYAVALTVFSIMFMPFDVLGWVFFAVAVAAGLFFGVYLLLPPVAEQDEDVDAEERNPQPAAAPVQPQVVTVVNVEESANESVSVRAEAVQKTADSTEKDALAKEKAREADCVKAGLEEAERAEKRAKRLARLTLEMQDERQDVIEAGAFRLSREDVLDYIDEMRLNTSDYPVEAGVRQRKDEKSSDMLYAGDWCFAAMSESKTGIIKFLARMDEAFASFLKKFHPTIEAVAVGGEEWYKVIIDETYYSKKEVFIMIDNWYAHSLKRYSFDPAHNCYVTDTTAAEDAAKAVDSLDAAASVRDEALIVAEKHRAEYDRLAAKRLNFHLTKKEISAHVRENFGEDVLTTERAEATITNLPLADTYHSAKGVSDKGVQKEVCFAYVYQQKNGSIKLIVKLPKAYANEQSAAHPNLCRAKFPAGKGWYTTIIDSTYKTENEVYALLQGAKTYIESTESRD